MRTAARLAPLAILATAVSLAAGLAASGCARPRCAPGYVMRGAECVVPDPNVHHAVDAGAGEGGMGDAWISPPDLDGGEPHVDAAPSPVPDGGEGDGQADATVDASACGECAANASCVNGACECDPGFAPVAGRCEDRDECQAGQGDPCGEGGTCENTAGAYACTCSDGFRTTGGDAPTCVDIDECREASHGCGPGSCVNESPSYYCLCPAGYSGTNAQACTDIDECEVNNGGCGVAPCENAQGSFACGPCPVGFVGTDGACRWNDARLGSLSVRDAALTPAFEPGITGYVAQASAQTESVSFVPALPSDGASRGSISVDGKTVEDGAMSTPLALALGDNAFEVQVVAETGAARSYRVLVRRGFTYGPYVKASNVGSGDRFGSALAISADGLTMAVGAVEEDSASQGMNVDPLDDSAPNAGAVYLFRHGPAGWVQEAYLKASNAEAYDRFGAALSLSADGSTLVVGAIQEDSKGTNVDSPLQDDNSISNCGAAYVFERSASGWVQTAYLKASNPAWGYNPILPYTNAFGAQVSISGDGSTIAVAATGEASGARGVGGAQGQNFNSFMNAGAVYVFRRSESSWLPEAYVKSADTLANARFGESLALAHDGSLLVVGEPSPNSGTGAAYTYARTGQTWSFASKTLASNAGEKDEFGAALALSADGQTLLVGAPSEDSHARGLGATRDEQVDNSSSSAGAAYLYRRVGSAWEQVLYLKASNAAAGAKFGKAVALSHDGESMVVGAPLETGRAALGGDQSSSAIGSGAAYLFRKQQEVWRQIAYVKGPKPQASQAFAQRVALDGTGMSLAVGSEGENGGALGIDGDLTRPDVAGSGAVFLYR